MPQIKNMLNGLIGARNAAAALALVGAGAFAIGIAQGQAPNAPDAPSIPDLGGPVSQAYAPGANPELDALRERANELRNQVQKTPTSPEEQAAQRQAASDLASIQMQIQRLEAATSQFAEFKRLRDLQNAGAAPNDVPVRSEAYSPNLFGGGTPNDQLTASGLNSPFIADRIPGSGETLTEGDAALLREQKEGLANQYRQLQQTLRALQPGDEQLEQTLRQEQNSVLERLKEINLRLANAPKTETPPMNPGAAFPYNLPATNELPNIANANLPESDPTVKMRKVSEAVRLLREAGLQQLANFAAAESPRLADPNFVETSIVPGAWTEGAGLAEERYNPFQQISAKDVEGINNSIEELKKRVDTLTNALENVETQLKLLTRQQVSGYSTPAVAPTPTPEPEANAPAAPTESAPEDDVEALLK